MHDVVRLEQSGVYDDGSLQLLLGLSPSSLAAARRAGSLRYCRKGRRILYLGRWVLEWIDTSQEREGGSHAE